jgi:alkanesulfonate monooxygenase SsuD/methylene tetrahydromethanopterin reductase-like flavin-dependent oxidoreductase (luciferase family)
MGDPSLLVTLATAAEAKGWDGVFLWDHVHFVRAAHLEVHDPWTVLGAIAHRTERVRLGTLVTPVARRQPWELAKQVVTLDHLSHGRAVLGVGLGEPGEDEFAAFGLPASAHERAARLDEGLTVLEGLLTGEPFVHAGEAFRVDAELRPAPVQRPRPPIWVAGLWPNRRPFDRARRYDGAAPIGAEGPLPPEQVAEVVAYLGELPLGFEVVATALDDVPSAEYADAGATWLVCSRWPMDVGWQEDLRRQIEAGPPT